MRKVFAVVLFFLGVLIWAEKPKDWNEPEYIKTIITVKGKAAGLPDGLAHCIAYKESRFKPTAKSRWVDGFQSVGLFQLYWKYIWELVDKFSDIPIDTFNWKNPEHSATVGCNYVAYLIDTFGSSAYLGVLAYNFGPNNLKNIKSVGDIPPRCIAYADDVIALWNEWDPSW